MNFNNLPNTENQLKKKSKVTTLKQQIKEKVKLDNQEIIDSVFGKDSFILETKRPKCKHNYRYDYIYKFRHHCRYDFTNNFIKRNEKKNKREKEIDRIINMNKE